MTYCCEHMAEKINYKCSTHNDPFECPDHLICYSEDFRINLMSKDADKILNFYPHNLA